jgi:hypothetical protein
MKEIFLYEICSAKECEQKTGYRMSPCELMSGDFKKTQFADAVSTAQANNLTHWFVECRRVKQAIPNDPFEISMYFNGVGSYTKSIKVFVIGE